MDFDLNDPKGERRTIVATGLHVRTITRDDGDDVHVLEGHAAVFDSDSEDMGFIEQIVPGAFKDAIDESDVRALFNHNPDNILGRAPETLRLSEDKVGLKFEIDLPDTEIAHRVRIAVKRGDIKGNSFAFTVAEDEWEYDQEPPRRRIVRVDELFDVGPVTYPAYPGTTVSARAMDCMKAAKEHRVKAAEDVVQNVTRERITKTLMVAQ